MSNASRMKSITRRAKQIYARGGTWHNALKKAGAEYRGSGKKRSGGSKRRKKKSTRKRKVGVVWPAAVGKVHHPETISHHVAAAKGLIADKIADKERQKFITKLKRNKRKIQKEISELKRQYRKL